MDVIVVILSQCGNCKVKSCDVEEAKRETSMGSHDWIKVNVYRTNMVFKYGIYTGWDIH